MLSNNLFTHISKQQIASGLSKATLVDSQEPHQLEAILQHHLSLPDSGGGRDALLSIVRDALFKYSVNTWNLGFMDKLYGSTNAVSINRTHLLTTE